MSIIYRKSCKLTDRPPGYVTIAINESFNKTFKESFKKYIQSTVIDMFIRLHCHQFVNITV